MELELSPRCSQAPTLQLKLVCSVVEILTESTNQALSDQALSPSLSWAVQRGEG